MNITIINTDGKFVANRGIEDLILPIANANGKIVNHNGLTGKIISDKLIVNDGVEGRVIILDVTKGVYSHPTNNADPLRDNIDRETRHNINVANRPSAMQEVANKLEEM